MTESGRRLTVAASAAVVAVLAVGFTLIFRASLPPAEWRVVLLPMAVLDQLDPRGGDYHEAAVDADYGIGARYVAFRLPQAGEGAAVFVNQVGTNAAVWCCDGVVDLDGGLFADHRRRFMEPFFQRLSQACDGAEAYLIVSNHPATDEKSLAHLYLGPAAELYQIYGWRRFLMVDLPRISTGVGALILLLTLAYYPRLSFGPAAPWFAGLLGAVLAHNIHIFWLIDALEDRARWTIGYPVAALYIGRAAAFAAAWTGDDLRRVRFVAGAGVVVAAGIFASFLIWGAASLEPVILLNRIFQVGAMIYAVWRFAVFARRADPSRYWEVALFLGAIGVFAFDLWMNTTGRRTYLSTYFPVFVFVIVLAAAAARSAEAYAAMARLNEMLDAKLIEKEAELAAEFARAREGERLAAQAEERRRIMADMHDGIGARLLGLAADAQVAGRRAEDLVPDIHGAVEDLRLIVNAMDAVGDDLIAALAGFRQTVEPKLRAAGFELDWRIDRSVWVEGMGADAILQLYRLMQEACANAMRHSGGSVLRIALAETAEGARLTIADNGSGLHDTRREGRGLGTMADRASRIGARLAVGRSDLGGAEVAVSFQR